jgi:hypothetical protein
MNVDATTPNLPRFATAPWLRAKWAHLRSHHRVSDRLIGARLGEAGRAVIAAAADTLFPAGESFPVSGSAAGVVEFMAQYVDRSRPIERVLIRLLLLYTDLGPLAFGPRPLPFTKLSAAERGEHLRGAANSRIYLRRIAFTSLRALLTMGYLDNEQVAQRIGIKADSDPFGLGKPGARKESTP